MSKPLLLFLDGFFFTFHAVLVLFNVFGWIPTKTRRLNLACLTLTAVSWFLMGLWKGVGYCILTDWHWQVRRALGIHDPDGSYIELLIRKLTGWASSSRNAATQDCASRSLSARPIRTPISRIRSDCCARAASGHVAAALPTSVMNSRRLIRFLPQAGTAS